MTSASRIAVAVLLSAIPFVVGCDDDDDPVDGETCQDYADVTPGGSFENDVIPLFSRSCALSTSCHQGGPGEGIEDLGLGPSNSMDPPDQMMLDDIHEQLLTQAPNRSSLPFVDPENPTGSWLMAKIEYDAADMPECSQCTDCGVLMPQNSTQETALPREERDVIAAWILDGAQNN
jgi:hypothetical protein